MKIRLPQAVWYENREAEIDFPDTWSVSLQSMKGSDTPCLSHEQMAHAFANPIGTPPIKKMAKGRKKVVIIFDDLARSTPTYAILPYLMKELHSAGVEDSQIRFVMALGAHGAHTANDFRKKLGQDTIDRFPVFNHNPFGACTFLGNTSRGTPVSINNEVMACDLKIGIGAIVPHPLTGFGGGGKIVLPGVAHMDSIVYHHGHLGSDGAYRGMGTIEGNILHLDIEEAARMAGLDVKIDALVNLKGEVAGLFVGEHVLEHREGVRMARDFYATELAKDMDIVVVNAYTKSNEAFIAFASGSLSLKKRGGDLVFITNEPAGQVIHYLCGEFGTGRDSKFGFATPPDLRNAERLIAVMPFNDPFLLGVRRDIPNVVWVKTWRECLNLLQDKWAQKAQVAVYPDATVQYFPESIAQRQS